MASSSSKKMKVKCRADEVLEVDASMFNASETLKRFTEEKCNKGENEVSLPNISRKTLSKINEYVKKHADADADAGMPSKSLEKSLHDWDAEFIQVDLDTLHDLISAAHYLKIENLFDLACEHVAEMIRGKTPEQIRRIFNIKNDYTPEEEVELRRNLPWFY